MASPEQDSQPSQDSIMTVTEENRQEVLYFAYGSNLSTEQMRRRCPFSTPVGLARLPDWRWFINTRGYANIVSLPPTSYRDINQQATYSRGDGDGEGKAEKVGGDGGSSSAVYGLLYLLPPGDEDSLDDYEGVPWAYQKFQCEVQWVRDAEGREKDETVRALVYIDVERTDDGIPRTEYVGRMEKGIEEARAWGLNEDYAENVMRKFWK